MRILIADDEQLTRKGMIAGIDWHALGITQIDDADDGVNALALAQKHAPDILLTDVRMPRMDGILLAKQIRAQFPGCPIIFMSGYSDKEYLKAAISLKAVSYVEKPFTPDEISDALTEAVALVKKQQLQKESEQFFKQEASSKLALALTQPGASLPAEHLLSANQYFTTVIISTGEQMLHMADEHRAALFSEIRQMLDAYHISELHTLKHTAYVIIHLYSSKKHEPNLLLHICRNIQALLRAQSITQFHLILGETVKGCSQVYASYNSAVFLLQSAFFTPYGTLLTPYEKVAPIAWSQLHQFPARLREVLTSQTRQSAEINALCDELFHALANNRELLPNQARDLYYKLLTVLSNLKYEAKISSAEETHTLSPLEQVNSCATFDALHECLCASINEYLSLLEHAVTENTTLFLIKDYIAHNYHDSSLSIKDISNHVHLSSPYLCTVFKTETGQTLNQYLTHFRMEKAKQLLSDPRSKINEIAAQVGYGDQNYFGKTFKKIVGLSPSEYREKEVL